MITGQFTSGLAGTYTVAWTLNLWDTAIGFPAIYLRKNEVVFEESRTDGSISGRNLVIHLGRGDILDLYCYNCSFEGTVMVDHLAFCVSLSHADVEQQTIKIIQLYIHEKIPHKTVIFYCDQATETKT